MIDLELSGVKCKVYYSGSNSPYAGGSKSDKLEYFLKDATIAGATGIISAGAANSNHAKEVALACARKGWKCTLVVHDSEDYSKGNLLIMKLAGAKLVFTTLAKVKETMQREFSAMLDLGLKPYYIHGGGHGIPGYLAFYDAAGEFIRKNEDFVPDYVVHASGTGGTQAGLIVGFNQSSPRTSVLGISIARDKLRGIEIIRNSCDELTEYLGLPKVKDEKINFFDDWRGDGYGRVSLDLINTIKEFAKSHGLLTDPTYTGKALQAMVSLMDEGYIPRGSKVLFWHTGGLINLLEYTQELVE